MRKPDFLSSSSDKGKMAFKGGSYSLVITAVVLAILIAINIFVSVLPVNLTKYDISSTKLYSVTSNTKAVVNALTEDVTIYWVVQADKEDDVIENLLAKYDSLSDHIEVVKKNPDVYPTFTQQYTDETVSNNSLIVECGDKSRYIPYDDIYLISDDAYYYYGYSLSPDAFDGEGAITSAIDYVVSEDFPQIYVLEGHGESELPATFAEQVKNENIEVSTLSLLTVDEIPEDADCLMIYSPTSDISDAEAEMLSSYVSNGGKLLVMAGPSENDALENLYGILTPYGVEASEGIVVESDRSYYFQYPYILLPEMQSSAITDSLIEANYYALLPIACGLTVTGSSYKGTVTELLTTTDASFSKIAGFELATYEKEDGDIDGPFAVAVSIEDDSGGQIVWFSSSDFLADDYNAYSSGANADLGMNSLAGLIGETEAMAIRSKSLNYNYLTISESTASLLKMTIIGIFPLAYFVIGVVVVLRRRRLQNETH